MTTLTGTPHETFERGIRERRYIRFTCLRSTDPITKKSTGRLNPDERECILVMFGPWDVEATSTTSCTARTAPPNLTNPHGR